MKGELRSLCLTNGGTHLGVCSVAAIQIRLVESVVNDGSAGIVLRTLRRALRVYASNVPVSPRLMSLIRRQ